MSTIVPRPTPAQAKIEATRLSRADGCPEACGNYTLPLTVTPEEQGFRAEYRCEDCGYSWSTSWSDDRVEWIL